MNKLKLSVLLILVFAVILSGCSSSGGSEKTSLTGTEWVMFEMDGVKYEPATGKDLTIKLNSGIKKAAGRAPCNTYSADYSKLDNKLSFGQILSTEMACGEMEAESMYFNMLPKTFAYQISGDKLYFFDSGGMVIFRFRAKQ